MALKPRYFDSRELSNIPPGTPGYPSQCLIQGGGPIRGLAFIDETFGTAGYDVVLIDQALQVGQIVEKSVALIDWSGFNLEVLSTGYGEFSIHDGSAWHGPFPVAGCVPYGMLVGTTTPSPVVLVRFKALHVCNRVYVRTHTASSPAQLAALEAMQ